MRKVVSFICALILTAMLPCAWLASRCLPADSSRYAAQKYAGWSGVIQIWICSDWECGGSFASWLSRCAALFEKAHEGVYIECEMVSPQALREIGSSDMRIPELLIFSPGLTPESGLLGEIGASHLLRPDLPRDSRVLPVAMGGTIFALNRSLAQRIDPAGVIVPVGYDRETAALLSGGVDAPAEFDPPGIDLGLPAFSEDKRMDALLESFIDGELACLPVTQAEIAKLARLRSGGKGPDWELLPTGAYAFTDQLMLAALTAGEGERYDLARAFAHMLLQEDCQQMLSDIGAFSVTGQAVHPPHSVYAPLDMLLHTRPLRTPDRFAEHSP